MKSISVKGVLQKCRRPCGHKLASHHSDLVSVLAEDAKEFLSVVLGKYFAYDSRISSDFALEAQLESYAAGGFCDYI